jgi:hypothetical protein
MGGVVMPQEMQGRRLSMPECGERPILAQAGDYYGPMDHGGKLAVFYLLPNARDHDAPAGAQHVHHVVSPPHVFKEEPDGTLTIRESIGAQPAWHGFLTNGRWELSKSKP